MKVIVTGGAGMIGSHVAGVLTQSGAHVIIIDNLSRGNRDNLPKDAEFFCTDIRNTQEIKALADKIGTADAIIHQASIINEGIDSEDIETDLSVNINGTLNLLEMAKAIDTRRFLYASSVAVYGRPDLLPAMESSSIPMPIASYGIGKLAAEQYVRYAAQAYGFSYACLRYANIFGPRQSLLGEVGAIRYFVENLKTGMPISVHGDGTQCRDFLYVDDCVEATLAVLYVSNDLIVNIGSGKPTSVNDLVASLRRVVGEDFIIKYGPARHGDIGKFWCSTELLRSSTTWAPKVGLDEGIHRTFAWRNSKEP